MVELSHHLSAAAGFCKLGAGGRGLWEGRLGALSARVRHIFAAGSPRLRGLLLSLLLGLLLGLLLSLLLSLLLGLFASSRPG
jgi:hypothetical protein